MEVTENNGIRRETAENQMVFALDIGTRSIIGMVGQLQEGRINILAIERAEHTGRTMIDGQIENIDRVASLVDEVKKKLEKQLETELKRVNIASAGRALRTQRITFEMELPEVQLITEEIISRLEAEAISAAEEAFAKESGAEDVNRRFYLAGYSICQYYLDDYLMSTLKDHHGKKIRVDIIATFLPGEVVESLYTTMNKVGLEVAGITLEPIAAINAVIPEDLRLLNLALADIGAGTSDIAACRDGSVIGYTMATIAGDEITETIMKEYLVDFRTAERIKMQLEERSEITFLDVLGFEQTISYDDLMNCINQTTEELCKEIAEKIKEINGGVPSAVFLSGGGSRLKGLREGVIQSLEISPNRVAIAGNNFSTHAFSEKYELNNPEYATPIGILVSAGLNLINDSFQITLNEKPAKLFRSGVFNARDLLMMNGYSFQDMIGRVGKNVVITVNGKRTVFYATPVEPAVLKINDQEGKLSDTIQAGDTIVFHPAVHGVTPQVKLGEIEGIADAKCIWLNGEENPSPDTLLKFGDEIQFDGGQSTENVPEVALEAIADQQQEVKPMHELQQTEENPVAEEEKPIEPIPQVEPEETEPVQSEAAEEAEVPMPIEKVAEKESSPQDMGVTFMLNGAPVTLMRRDKGNPYLLMDMLQYSGIDFSNLSGEVILQVNGSNGYFQQPLKEGDRISIYEEKK